MPPFVAIRVSFRVTHKEIIRKCCHVHFKVVSFSDQTKPELYSDWSPLGIYW